MLPVVYLLEKGLSLVHEDVCFNYNIVLSFVFCKWNSSPDGCIRCPTLTQRLAVLTQPLSQAPTPPLTPRFLSLPTPTHPRQTAVLPRNRQQHVVTRSIPGDSAGSRRPKTCGPLVPSNTHDRVKARQIVSNSPQQNPKNISQSNPLLTLTHSHTLTHSLSLTHTHTGSVSRPVWPRWMWISAEPLTTRAPACQHVCCRWSDASN